MDIKNNFSGRLIIDPYSYNHEPNRYPEDTQESISITYGSTEKERVIHGRSGFDVWVYRNKNKEGLITIAIIDQINEREFGLVELK